MMRNLGWQLPFREIPRSNFRYAIVWRFKGTKIYMCVYTACTTSKAMPQAESKNELDFVGSCPTTAGLSTFETNFARILQKTKIFSFSPCPSFFETYSPRISIVILIRRVRHNGRTYNLQITNLTLHRVSVYLTHVVPSVALADITYM